MTETPEPTHEAPQATAQRAHRDSPLDDTHQAPAEAVAEPHKGASAPPWTWKTDGTALGLILGLTLAVFAPTLGFDFVTWDDAVFVTQNPLVTGAEGVTAWDWLTTPTLGYPIPVTVLTYRLEAALSGMAPWLFHLDNVLLHLGAVGLLYSLLRRLGLKTPGAALAATIFALHPVVAEPVSWATGRKDLLAAAFGLGAAWCWWRSPAPSLRDGSTWAATALFALAMLSKPAAVFWPPLLVVMTWLLVKRRHVATALTAIPMTVVAAIVVPLAFVGLRTVEDGGRQVSSLTSLLREAWFAWGFHLRLLTFQESPTAKYLFTSWPPEGPVWSVDLLPLLAIGVAAALLAWLPARRRPLALIGMAWAALAYLPSANLIPLTRLVADSYLYMPLAGLAMTLGVAMDAALDAKPAEAASKAATSGEATAGPQTLKSAAIITALALSLAALTLPASDQWRDSVSLWGHAHQRYPHDMRLCRNFGNAWFKARQRPDLALAQYERCAEAYGDAPFLKNMALMHLRLRQPQQAKALLERHLQNNPNDAVSRRNLQRLR